MTAPDVDEVIGWSCVSWRRITVVWMADAGRAPSSASRASAAMATVSPARKVVGAETESSGPVLPARMTTELTLRPPRPSLTVSVAV